MWLVKGRQIAESLTEADYSGRLALGYFLDETSYPGERVIYVVVFAASTRSKGSAYALFEDRPMRFLGPTRTDASIHVQNDARCVLSRGRPQQGNCDFHGTAFARFLNRQISTDPRQGENQATTRKHVSRTGERLRYGPSPQNFRSAKLRL
jgi:hypothetical protein